MVAYGSYQGAQSQVHRYTDVVTSLVRWMLEGLTSTENGSKNKKCWNDFKLESCFAIAGQ